MKILITLLIIFLFPISYSFSDTKALPDIFLKCEGGLIPMRWLFKIDRINKIGEVKVPYVDNNFKICHEDSEKIVFKRDCTNGLDELEFNKWDGSFQSSDPCQFLSEEQKPLYE